MLTILRRIPKSPSVKRFLLFDLLCHARLSYCFAYIRFLDIPKSQAKRLKGLPMMSTHWPGQIAAFRRAHDFTQQDLADILKVTAATISRWESGVQIPDFAHVAMIRKLMRLERFNSLEEWCYRVNRSLGYEILVDAEDKAVAVSAPILAFRNLLLEQGLGRDFRTLLPESTAQASSAEHTSVGTSSHRAKLFERKLRLIKYDTQVRIGGVAVKVLYDVWPISTSSNDIYALMIFRPMGPISDPQWDGNYRILSYETFPMPDLRIPGIATI